MKKRYYCICTWLHIACCWLIPNGGIAQPQIYIENGLLKATPYSHPDIAPNLKTELENIKNQPTTAEQEEGFWKRSTEEIYFRKSDNHVFGNTFFENEKASYPAAMYNLIFGLGYNQFDYIKPAVSFLEASDNGWGNGTLTESVDLFPSFTLKGQVPKYFYFGKHTNSLTPAYMEQMRRAFFKWTHDSTGAPIDPFRRPHPFFRGPCANENWTPECRNSWSDTRNTDNLKAMRETSTYLFSEEIGNEAIRLVYKNRIRDHVAALYHIGYSEWDSENYFSHSVAPFQNLYAYAKDPAVKKYAKAALDWYMTAGAAKYYRGLAAGPARRVHDGANILWGDQIAPIAYHYFGAPYAADKYPDRDTYISILSGYRPPQAIYELGVKKLRRNMEQRNTKPSYGGISFLPDLLKKPETWETMFYGNTYHFGSAVTEREIGTSLPIRAFKLAAYNSARGAEGFFMNTSKTGKLNSYKNYRDQIGQHRNKLIYMRPADSLKFIFEAPKAVPFEQDGSYWFFKFEKTWLGMYVINLNYIQTIDLETVDSDLASEFMHVAEPITKTGYAGLVMEIGEVGQFADFNTFKAAFKTKTKVDLAKIDTGELTFTGTDGEFIRMQYNTVNDLPVIYRNSNLAYNWSDSTNSYHTYKALTPPTVAIEDVSLNADNGSLLIKTHAVDTLSGIYQDWKSGLLRVYSKNHVFTSSFTKDGTVTWSEEPASKANARGRLKSVTYYVNDKEVGQVTDGVKLASEHFDFGWGHTGAATYRIKAKVTDEDGEVAWSEEKVFVLTNLIPEQALLDNDVKVYPNPASDILHVTLPTLESYSVTLMSANGQAMYNTIHNSGNALTIPVNGLAKGVYVLRLQTEKALVHKKVVVE